MIAYLTIREVAEQMRCEHRTVRRAIKSGELHAAMIGGKWIIREDDVNAWFQSRCPASVISAAAIPRTRRAPSPRIRDQMGLGASADSGRSKRAEGEQA